jgi:hypothetical protein
MHASPSDGRQEGGYDSGDGEDVVSCRTEPAAARLSLRAPRPVRGALVEAGDEEDERLSQEGEPRP